MIRDASQRTARASRAFFLRAAPGLLICSRLIGVACAAPDSSVPAIAQEAGPGTNVPAGPAVAGVHPDGAPYLGADALPDILIQAGALSPDLHSWNQDLDLAREHDLLPAFGASAFAMESEDLDALPQGEDTPIDKVLLQAPGVSYDAATSNPGFHVRNEYANVQYRINGIALPDGVSALGPVLGTGLVGSLRLLDGSLPAQYGLRTAAVVDITTRSLEDSGTDLSLTGGSRGSFATGLAVGADLGANEIYLMGRHEQSAQGLESATPGPDPIHDRDAQERMFGYVSSRLDASTRLTLIAAASRLHYQIPDVADQAPLGDVGPPSLASSSLDERETDRYAFALAALQTHDARIDTQSAVVFRDASVEFLPDIAGDLAFNDVAANIARISRVGGLQSDLALRLDDLHTLRAGIATSIERTDVLARTTALPVLPSGQVLPVPVTIVDRTARTGTTASLYAQEQWRLPPSWTLNAGLRWDRAGQFFSASQWSPRLALEHRGGNGALAHLGLSRYFTPPMQAQASPLDVALYAGTTQQAAIARDDPVRPERATVLDAGYEREFASGLTLGLDAYCKRATDLLDDGQFGQAVMLTQFNYAHGTSRGIEGKLDWRHAGMHAYLNASVNITRATRVVSSQADFSDPAELAFSSTHDIFTDDAQETTASGGVAGTLHGTSASIDAIFGSGLRSGFANLQRVPSYASVNAALVQQLHMPGDPRNRLRMRLSVVNLFDRSYRLRSGTGIGEFAPQYGPRRGIFLGLELRL